jgi:hypothetical protein
VAEITPLVCVKAVIVLLAARLEAIYDGKLLKSL